MSAIALLLERLTARHGLRFDGVTRSRFDRALAQGAAVEARTTAAHAAALLDDPEAQQALVDEVTLQETSFFRDPVVFAALRDRVLPDARRRAAGPLVVWSAGCANGQEAWSIAMLLTELGVPDFRVVATDVAATAVARARAGTYDERELRGLDPARRRRFGRTAPDGTWTVADALRPRVTVLRQNAAASDPPITPGTADLVLCRYVLIYLTPRAADHLLARVERLLHPDGLLVIGAAESLWHLSERFAPVTLPGAFGYRRRTEHDLPAGPVPRPVAAPTPSPQPPPPQQPASAPAPSPPAPKQPAPDRVPLGVDEPDPAELRHAGERAAAAGDLPAAAAAFRAAAYLDPDDAIALVQLGLTLEALQDPGAGRAFGAAWAALGRRSPATDARAFGGFRTEELARLLAEKLDEHGVLRA